MINNIGDRYRFDMRLWIYYPAASFKNNQTYKKYFQINIYPDIHSYLTNIKYIGKNMFEKIYGVFLYFLEHPAAFLANRTGAKK